MKKIECDCGGEMKYGKTKVEGKIADCIKCNNCGQVGFDLKQTKTLIRNRT